MAEPLNVVLVEPEIPQNTGNVARLCAASGTALHLVRPFGFLLGDRQMKRAGLDYWDRVEVTIHDSLAEFIELASQRGGTFHLATTSGGKRYSEVSFGPGDWLLFGAETRGLPRELLTEHPERCIRIPMAPGLRSLNLANSVAIVVYETLRQMGYPGLQ